MEGFLGGSLVKNPPANAGDAGLIPGLGSSLREGNGNPLQYSCLGNPMDRGTWGATVHEVARIRHDLATGPAPPLPSSFRLSHRFIHTEAQTKAVHQIIGRSLKSHMLLNVSRMCFSARSILPARH